MESNKNDNNNGGDNEHEKPQRTAQKRKLNEMTNDEDKSAEAAGQEDQECANSKKNREEGNCLDLELEHLSREELIKLVRKQMTVTTVEAQKQMETAKKQAEESAKQAEEFSQRNIQLEQEKAEVQEDFHQKMAEIVGMHKEVKEKSEQLAKKAKQIDALLLQLNESTSHQRLMPPTEQEMKIQLAKETWYDWLGFVPRRQLGEIVPKIGDRKFASIVQPFLHEYGEITIDRIDIVAPYEEDPGGPHPRVRGWQNDKQLKFKMAEAQMPANIKHFLCVELRYFDQSVLNFMQKFQQNGLLDNVCLYICQTKDIVQPVLCHLLPLINGIKSIDLLDSAQLVDFYDAGNSKEIYELNMKMMEETRILKASYDRESLHAKTIDLYCRWLCQTTRADGKPRVLNFGTLDMDSAPVSLFIDRIKKDFLMATDPVTFNILINLPNGFEPQEAICLDNGKTKERLLIKMEETKVQDLYWGDWKQVVLLISRYPLASTKKWIEENEKEILNLDFGAENGRGIFLSEKLKVVPI